MDMTWDKLLSEAKLSDLENLGNKPAPEQENGPKKEVDDAKDKAKKSWDKYPVNAFELDYNKIVNSAAFRRLQDKTQVFPLSKSDFVRTRLTHSIEVSTIAYQLGEMLINYDRTKETGTDGKPTKSNEMIQKAKEDMEQHQTIPSVLRCAGLIHDLGNPPFGHFGEETIGNWFRENLDKIEYKGNTLRAWLTALNENGEDEIKKKIKEEIKPALQRYLDKKKEEQKEREEPRLGDEAIADLEHFEGNAQALRLLCKARYAGDIKVSCAVISSLVKYPTTSLAFLAYKKDKEENEKKKDRRDDIKLHKPGVYAAEKKVFGAVSDAVGTKRDDGTYCRHPLTYLMEASDDIAYATSDLEDAFKKKLFTLEQFIDFYNKQLDPDLATGKAAAYYEKQHKKGYMQEKTAKDNREMLAHMREAAGDGDLSDAAAFSEWLYYIRRWLMYTVAYKFSNNYRAIMDGNFREDMFEGEFNELTLYILKDAMGKFVYDGESLAPTELSGRTILNFLLDGFVQAALYKDKAYADDNKDEADAHGPYKPSQENNKYLGLLSDTYKKDYELARTGDEAYDLYLRLLMVTDHISSMTDAYARDLFRSLRGME